MISFIKDHEQNLRTLMDLMKVEPCEDVTEKTSEDFHSGSTGRLFNIVEDAELTSCGDVCSQRVTADEGVGRRLTDEDEGGRRQRQDETQTEKVDRKTETLGDECREFRSPNKPAEFLPPFRFISPVQL